MPRPASVPSPQLRRSPQLRSDTPCATPRLWRSPTLWFPCDLRSEASEPDREFALRRLDGVRAVHEVLLHLEAPVAAQVAAEGAGSGRRRVGRAGQRPEALDDAVAGEADRDGRPRHHELEEGLVERLAFVLGVVLLERLAIGLDEADVDERVSLRLDAGEDLPRQPTGDAVGLHEDEGLFGGHFSLRSRSRPRRPGERFAGRAMPP